jgi:hypothetical protein
MTWRPPIPIKELQDLFWVEATKYQVLPLDASALTRFILPAQLRRRARRVHLWSHSLREQKGMV